MDESTWAFTRGRQRLEVCRYDAPGGTQFIVTVDGSSRTYWFRDEAALHRFQSDMEAFLLKTGWSFTQFSPDRRTGNDRRAFPRLAERRRWWTDGVAPSSKTVWGG